jgi:hypothetical protein
MSAASGKKLDTVIGQTCKAKLGWDLFPTSMTHTGLSSRGLASVANSPLMGAVMRQQSRILASSRVARQTAMPMHARCLAGPRDPAQ